MRQKARRPFRRAQTTSTTNTNKATGHEAVEQAAPTLKVLFENGLSEEQLCHRYDLVTAADGAESHYITNKTDGRHHSAKVAKALDAQVGSCHGKERRK